MNLTSGERTRTLPGLKPPIRTASSGVKEKTRPHCLAKSHLPGRDLSPCHPLNLRRQGHPAGRVQIPVQRRPKGLVSTIPRPQGRKTPEPGAVLAPGVTLLREVKQASEKDGGVSTGGQEFRQALNMLSSLPITISGGLVTAQRVK